MKIKNCKIKILCSYFDNTGKDRMNDIVQGFVLSDLSSAPNSQFALVDLGYTYVVSLENSNNIFNFNITEELDVDSNRGQNVKSNICSIRDIIGQNMKDIHIQL